MFQATAIVFKYSENENGTEFNCHIKKNILFKIILLNNTLITVYLP